MHSDRSEERSGLSAARNAGLSATTSPFVAFLDDNACADCQWLAKLRESMNGPEILGAGGRWIPVWSERRPKWFSDQLLWTVGCSYEGHPTEPSDVRNVFGGCAIYRRELFVNFGGFRKEFGRKERGAAGCEETEFCIRVASNRPGGTFRFQPQAAIFHHVPADQTKLSYLLKRSFAEGRSKALLVRSLHSSPYSTTLDTELTYLRSSLGHSIRSSVRHLSQGDAGELGSLGALMMTLVGTSVGFALEMMVGERNLIH